MYHFRRGGERKIGQRIKAIYHYGVCASNQYRFWRLHRFFIVAAIVCPANGHLYIVI